MAGYFLRKMKAKWAVAITAHVCRARPIQLGTELLTRLQDLFGSVVVHEMLHFIEPTHSERFIELNWKAWSATLAELRELPSPAAV